jgi:hypothetical protein
LGKIRDQSKKELGKSRGERRQVIRRRIEATETRIAVIKDQLNYFAIIEAERRKKEQMAEEALHWQAFERLRRHPTEENARSAKRSLSPRRKSPVARSRSSQQRGVIVDPGNWTIG